MIETVLLPEKMDQTAAVDLYDTLTARIGQSMELDGRNVRGVGGLSAQVLLVAARKWKADGLDITFSCSDAMQTDLQRLGLEQEILGKVTRE